MKKVILLYLFSFISSWTWSQVVTIDSSQTLQKIQGWECGTSMVSTEGRTIATDTSIQYYKDEVADLMVNEMGVNRVRLEVRSGSENARDYWKEYNDSTIIYDEWRANRYATINDNDDPLDLDMDGFNFTELDQKMTNAVSPLKNSSESIGEKLYVSLCYVAFTPQIKDGDYHHRDPAEYAEFILATFYHMEATYGFTPDAVEVILEPGVAKYGGGDLVGQSMVAAGDLLKQHGYTPDFIALSTTNLNNTLSAYQMGRFLQVPRISEYWTELSYHAYAGRTRENLDSIAALASIHGVRTSMLEWWTNSNTYERLHEDLSYGNNSAWQWRFSPVSPLGTGRGYYEVDWRGKDDYTIIPQSTPKYISKYFKNIKKGAQRIGASADINRIEPLAFVQADGRLTLVIKSNAPGDIWVTDLFEGEYEARMTTGDGRRDPSNNDELIADGSYGPQDTMRLYLPEKGFVIVNQIKRSTKSQDELHLTSVTISPNPASEFAVINSDEAIEHVRVYSEMGQLLYEDAMIPSKKYRLSTRGWTVGKYWIQLSTQRASTLHPLILQY